MKRVFVIISIAAFILSSCNNKQTTDRSIADEKITPAVKEVPNVTEAPAPENAAAVQPREFPKIMYVNSPEGLRIRQTPSLDSARIGVYLYGQRIVVDKRSDAPVTIDGITDYWYQTHHVYFENKYYDSAWVFGGYLSESLPLDLPVVLGLWEEENNEWIIYYFSPANNYSKGRKESEWFDIGKWELHENSLRLIIDSGAYEKLDNPETVEVTLVTVDRNHIRLEYPNGERYNLVRSEDPSVLY